MRAALARHDRALAELNATPGLAPEYRKRQAAKIRVTAQQELAAAAKAIAAEHERKLRGAQNKLFGMADNGAALDQARIAHRDAAERASRCETYEQAAALLNRAQINGDSQLAAAVVQESADRGWFGLADQWAADNPSVTATYREYRQLASRDDRLFRMVASAAVPPAPPELNGLTSGMIGQLAREADAEDGAA